MKSHNRIISNFVQSLMLIWYEVQNLFMCLNWNENSDIFSGFHFAALCWTRRQVFKIVLLTWHNIYLTAIFSFVFCSIFLSHFSTLFSLLLVKMFTNLLTVCIYVYTAAESKEISGSTGSKIKQNGKMLFVCT